MRASLRLAAVCQAGSNTTSPPRPGAPGSHARSRRLLPAILAAASLAAPFAAQTTNIVIPNPLTGEHPTALLRAAEKIVLELEAALSTDWAVSALDRPMPTPAPAGTGLIVRIEALLGDPISDTGYRMSVAGNGHFIIRTRTMEGAIDGLHGVRQRLMSDGYTGGFLSGGPVTVEPAFLRRGFMVLNPEPHWTEDDWKDYVDYHQLLGANVFTVGIPGLYDPADTRTHALAPAYADLAATMEHCHDVGLKFQITTAANMMSPGFYWDHFEPEHVRYDADGTTVDVEAAGEDAGAETDDGNHVHTHVPFPPGASMAKVAADSGLAADLAAHQANFYETFAQADAFLVAFTEGAADYGPEAIDDPVANIAGAHYAWVAEQVADGFAAAGGSDPEPAKLVHYGWLTPLWWAFFLSDTNGDGIPDTDGHAAHAGFSGWPESAHPTIDSYIDPDPGDTDVRGEWVQETGFFYSDLGTVFGTVAALNAPNPLPESTLDPLGCVADFEISSERVFDTTAFLYWTHKEPDLRNYFLRPAIRETIADLRAALRKDTMGGPGWNAHTAATGVMGYRPFAASRRFLNDFVVLRCASDSSLLDLGTADLDEPGLDALRDLVVADMTRFLLGGESDVDLVAALENSITLLDAALPLFSTKTPEDVGLALTELNDESLDWWDAGTLLGAYYQVLAFTAFTELAKAASTPTEEDDYVAAALRVARQTKLLFRYVSEAEVRALVDALGP